MDGTVDFDAVEWAADGVGIQAKAIRAAGSRWAVVEYGPTAERDEWCTDGHRGYVLEGAIEYDFEDGSPPLTCTQSRGFVLDAGKGHRGRNSIHTVTRLFLIDDPD